MGEQVSSCGCGGYDTACGNNCGNSCGCNNGCGGVGYGGGWVWWIIILAIIFLLFCSFGGGWC